MSDKETGVGNRTSSVGRTSAESGISSGPSPSAPPVISLPKGGGAIRGIGEKFAANPVTGTGSMSVPIATSPGRSGFGPQLSLSYDSGFGNGPFGLGWSLSLPAITRKTDKGLPRYHDAQESDVYILSGAEDLVPVYRQDPDGSWVAAHVGYQRDSDGSWVRDPEGCLVINEDERDGYRVRRYRPRIEGLFARIERWTEVATGEIHWRSITRDNVTALYGKDNNSRIFDPSDPAPAHPTRIFSWLICQSYDDKGNAVVYEYQPEDSKRIFEDQQGHVAVLAHESNRSDAGRSVNRYLKRIKYGNRTPNRDIATWQPTDPAQLPDESMWMFEVVFDYDEGHTFNETTNVDHQTFVEASVTSAQDWTRRPDPFSSYRAGFEVRTYRLCQRILMFHHIPDLPTGEKGYDGLVRVTHFTYAYEMDPTQAKVPVYTRLVMVTQSGYKRLADERYLQKSLPPLEFEYSEPIVQDRIEEVDAASLENLPIGLDGALYQWTDLHGEGIPGILTEQGDAWFYKRNLSPINVKPGNGPAHIEAKFAPVERVAVKPNLSLAGGAQFMDLAGDGQPDLVVMDGPMPGLYEHDDAEGWDSFRPFTSRLIRDTRDPNLKFVDLDGDGHADVLISEDDAFVWHASLAEAGFGPARRTVQALDEEEGPRLVFADGTQSIYLADLSGDGLTDLVRIRNGEVCYWPNLGYARFGAKVTMDHAPYFDNPDQFDQKRIRLADIDGSGTTDIIYLHRDGVRLYFNQSGNSWSEPRVLDVFPRVDQLVSIIPIDLLGNGTACLVWSSPMPGDAQRQMRYIDLMGGQKPHLLVKTINNLGAETRVHYVSSTYFYLKDKQAGTPWITRLPFPVHVVERVETVDHISDNRFVTRYTYHHGYFDGEEREFRGFGMVEQWDTEEFRALAADGQAPAGTNIDASSHVPPVLTRTWFHTGMYLGRNHISNFFAGLLDANDIGEYYREPGLSDVQARALLLDDTVLPKDLTLEEEREACRALKGSMLRQEVYARDGTAEAEHPYTVSEQNFTIRKLQPRGSNRHGVFFTHACESISYHYERKPADPRIGHTVTLEVDDYGNVLKSAAIGYGRRQPVPDQNLPLPVQSEQTKRQAQILITYTENSVTNGVDVANDHRTPLPCESLTYELTGYTPTGQAGRYQPADFVEPDPNHPGRLRHKVTDDVAYEEEATANPCRRLIEHVRTYYRRNNLAGSLPICELQSLALPFESYKLAFTPGLVAEVYSGRVSDPMLENEGRQAHTEGDANWWIPSGQIFYSPDPAHTAAQELAYARQHFFLPHRYRDPFHTNAVSTESFVSYDIYDLLVEETRDALDNRVTVGERHTDPTKPLVRRAQDYRVLQPALVMDPNRNRSAVAFDVLGMVAGTAVIGKPLPAIIEGDSLDDFIADVTQAQLDHLIDAPRELDPVTNEFMATQIVHDLLGKATTRIVYDLDRFMRLGEPPFAATIARETHVSDLQQNQKSKLQISFSYSDGFGREIQKKIQAEKGKVPQRDANGKIVVGPDGQPEMTPNDVSPRWVGSDWAVFNNKGKPVRQYEPFFSDRHRFEFDVKIGVSPVLFYDPVERVVATLHPNHTWEKVVFDPWRQETWDVNDTIVTDPRIDPDLRGFVLKEDGTARLPESEYLPSWHALRTDAAHAAAFAARYPDVTDRTNEMQAARKTEVHAATPTVAHADSLGRTFLTIAHNKAKYSDTPAAAPPVEEFHATRIVLDIEGNQREVVDAKDRMVMRYDYDMLGNRAHQASMEAGERWMLNDVAGKPLYAWDSRDHQFRTAYDQLRRPTDSFLSESGGTAMRVGQTVYGETHPGYPVPETKNLRGKVVELRDQAGLIFSDDYDFKGNLRESRRRLALDYKNTLDWPWPGTVPLEPETYTSRTRYDALNRPTQLIAPHAAGAKVNVIQPSYNEANLLEQVDAWLNRNAVPSGWLDPATASLHAVTNVNYDAKGQRTYIDHGTQDDKVIRTSYTYVRETFRLTHLYTRRGVDPLTAQSVSFTDDCNNPQPPPPAIAAPEDPPPGKSCGLQNLHYTYDPAGNITHIRDDSQQTTYFRNQRVEPSNGYTYDAIYRLIEATGREHLGQAGGTPIPHSYNDAGRVGIQSPPFDGRFHPHDGNAMGRYCECYEYDAVGNIMEMIHRAACPGAVSWRRSYTYNETSQLEATKKSNRLSSTQVGNGIASAPEQYAYDAHGNMLRMPHLQVMQWDFKDQLRLTQRQAVNAADADGVAHDGERTWYVYDSAGQRVRKVTESVADQVKDERIYVGGFEVYRKNGANPLARETLHIMDDKQRIALVETRTQGNEPGVAAQLIRYQFGNHLGSASLELDDQAQIISYEEYMPYGSTSYQAVRSQTETPRRYRYTGKERDEESGFYYHGARYYTPWLGRWVSSDPAGFTDGANLYAFAHQNPVRYSDNDGRQSSSVEDEQRYSRVTAQAGHGLRAAVRGMAPIDAGTAINKTFQLSGKPLSGTYHLWSGEETGKLAAKAAITPKAPGYIMGKTPQHIEAKARFDAATAHGGGGRLPTPEFREIWDPPSETVAVQATAAEHAIATHGKPAPDSVQTRIERPAVRRSGTISGGLSGASGAANIFAATQLENRVVKAIGVTSGVVEVAGGVTYAAGALKVGTPVARKLTQVGGTLSRFGGGIAGSVISGYGLVKDVQRGDIARGVGDAAGTVTGVLTVVGAGSAAAVTGAFSAGYAAGSLINEHLLSEETKNAVGGTIAETLEHGWENIKGFYFGG
jgi:RHS repeat-associated protein